MVADRGINIREVVKKKGMAAKFVAKLSKF